MILILAKWMVKTRSRNKRMESSILTSATTNNNHKSKEVPILSTSLESLLSQFRLNSKIINLILDLHLRIIQRELAVNKTPCLLPSKHWTHSLQTIFPSRILTKEFNSHHSRRRREDSSPTPCSYKVVFKPHNSNICNSNSNNNSRQTNTSSIRRIRWPNSNSLRCSTVLDSKGSNSQWWTKDSSAQQCHNMDNSNSKICKEVISSILEITHSNSNSQGSSKTNKQLVRHLTFFEIDKIKWKINKQIEKTEFID